MGGFPGSSCTVVPSTTFASPAPIAPARRSRIRATTDTWWPPPGAIGKDIPASSIAVSAVGLCVESREESDDHNVQLYLLQALIGPLHVESKLSRVSSRDMRLEPRGGLGRIMISLRKLK